MGYLYIFWYFLVYFYFWYTLVYFYRKYVFHEKSSDTKDLGWLRGCKPGAIKDFQTLFLHMGVNPAARPCGVGSLSPCPMAWYPWAAGQPRVPSSHPLSHHVREVSVKLHQLRDGGHTTTRPHPAPAKYRTRSMVPAPSPPRCGEMNQNKERKYIYKKKREKKHFQTLFLCLLLLSAELKAMRQLVRFQLLVQRALPPWLCAGGGLGYRAGVGKLLGRSQVD